MTLPEYQLICACANGDVEEVETLLKAGVDPNNLHPDVGDMPLNIAIRCFQPEIIKVLFKYGADPNAVICSEGLQIIGYMYPLDLAQFGYMNSFVSAEAVDIIYKILLENGSYKMNMHDCLTLKWMMDEMRVKERTKAYYYTSLCLPCDLSRMVAECF